MILFSLGLLVRWFSTLGIFSRVADKEDLSVEVDSQIRDIGNLFTELDLVDDLGYHEREFLIAKVLVTGFVD